MSEGIRYLIKRQLDMYEGLSNRYVKEDGSRKPATYREGRFSVSTEDTLTEQPVSWIWKDWLQKGCITLLAGAPGEGKSNIAAYLASRLSVGGILPDGETCKPGNSVIWSSEDTVAAIRARCVANGGDLSRINIIAGERKGTTAYMFLSEQDRLDFFRLVTRLERPELIIIDNILNIMCGRDPNNNIAVRQALAPFHDLAERYDIAVLLVAHTSKSVTRRNLAYATLGSIAFSGVARAQLNVVKRAGSNEGIIVRGKSNISSSDGGYPFKLVPTTVGEQDIETVRVEWGNCLADTPAELIADCVTATTDMRAELEDWLTALLADGPVPSHQIYREATANGFSRTSVKLAKQRLNIQHRIQRQRNVRGGCLSYWYFP